VKLFRNITPRRALRWAAQTLCLASAGFVLLALARSGLVSPEPTLLLRDRNGLFLGEIPPSPDTELGYWPLQSLPGRVIAATLAIEDRHFFSHPGVDPIATIRALRQLLRNGRRVSGASTLAMQIARMQSPGSRTYPRKALETLTALFLTLRHGREAILAHYLRIVPYGNRIHGIAYAARRYLDKPVEDLSWAEIAFLTAIPQAPARMNPFSAAGRERAIARGKRILGALLRAGAISAAEHRLALLQIDQISVPRRGERSPAAMHAILRLQSLLRDPEARRAFRNRPIVSTSLDLELQERVTAATAEAVRGWEGRGAGNAAVLVLDRRSLEVLAWTGSTGYFDARHAGAMDYALVERSPGSTLKPFLYALALERGLIAPASVLDDLERAPSGISNSDDAFLGPILPRVALANSRNVPAVHLLQDVGLDEAYGFFQTLGLNDGRLPARHYGLEMAIGGLPTTLEHLVRAYGVLSGDGTLRELRWWQGQALPAPVRVISEDTARQVTLFLSDAMARLPTFPRLGTTEYPFPVAVKTGTSTAYRDAWAVEYSTRYVVGVWVGHPSSRPMNRLSGYRSAARLAQSVMLGLHADEAEGLSNLSFPPPRGARPIRVCARTGRLATEACDQVLLEWFRPGQEPTSPCTAHVRLAVDVRNGLLATSRTPPEYIEIQTFTDLDPRYAAWAAGAGLPHPPIDFSPPDGSKPESLGQPGDGSPQTRDGSLSGPAQRWRSVPSKAPVLRVTAPENGETVLRDPEVPAELSSLVLSVVAEPPVEQLVWYVDGEPYQVVDSPYTARWQIRPGEHTFQARVPFTGVASAPVHVRVE
jgi:penicillin-binding protein 1C